MTAKVIQVIETDIVRGAGELTDPLRHVTQYWSFDGQLLAENDPCPAPGPAGNPTVVTASVTKPAEPVQG